VLQWLHKGSINLEYKNHTQSDQDQLRNSQVHRELASQGEYHHSSNLKDK